MSEATEVNIRPAEPADAVALLNLVRQLAKETTTFTADSALSNLDADKMATQIQAINQTRDQIIMVASLGSELLGLATVDPLKDGKSGEVGVAVSQAVWGQGLGGALLDETIYWATSYSQLTKLTLTVQTRNQRALRLYQHLGFQITRDDYQVQTTTGEWVSAIDMAMSVE